MSPMSSSVAYASFTECQVNPLSAPGVKILNRYLFRLQPLPPTKTELTPKTMLKLEFS